MFIKDKLIKKGVSPVFYLNNVMENHSDTIEELQEIIERNPNVAKKLLPLFSHFSAEDKDPLDKMDFSWEREWRFPAVYGNLEFSAEDIFIGLCPADEIEHYEENFGEKFSIDDNPLRFIDPLKPSRWYATKLVQSRRRIKMEHSVV